MASRASRPSVPMSGPGDLTKAPTNVTGSSRPNGRTVHGAPVPNKGPMGPGEKFVGQKSPPAPTNKPLVLSPYDQNRADN